MRPDNETNNVENTESAAEQTAAEGAAEAEPTPDPKPDAAPPKDDSSAKIATLEAKLAEAAARAETAEKNYLYLQAEFQNFRRRREEEFVAQQKFLTSDLIKSLLPILDNFERAIQAAEANQSFEKLIGGVQGTLKQLNTFLEKAGVTPIEAVGKEFDPNFHDAIGHSDDSDLPANTVTDEVQRGYIMHERVLRPSLVKVSQG